MGFSSETPSTGGGGGGNAFGIIQADTGTSPTADSPNDILTLTNTDGLVTINGNATTDTIEIDLATGTARNVLGRNASGVVYDIGGWAIDSVSGGPNIQVTATPAGETGGQPGASFSLNVEPTANSPDLIYNVHQVVCTPDSASSGFDLGTNGSAINLNNWYINAQGTGNLGGLAMVSQFAQVGNGTDPIEVKGLSYAYGFGDIEPNVTMSGPLQGYGFQPNVSSASIWTSTSYQNAFYDFANIQASVGPYQSFVASPTIFNIKNNTNYAGVNIAPTITSFSGNAGFNGISISPTIGTAGTNGVFGVTIQPSVGSAGAGSMTGLYINMNNVLNGSNVKAMDIVGDVSINGALSFTGALSIGQLTAFYATNPVSSPSNPTTLHGLVTSMTALNGVTTANCDTIGVNTAMLITLEDNSVCTSGALQLGFAALALPCVVETKTGSTLDYMSAAVYAINLSGTSTGGTIDNINICRSVPIPNGITTVNNSRGFYYHEPFGGIATTSWGFYNEADNENFLKQSLKIGGTVGTTDVVSNTSVGLELESTTRAIRVSIMTTTQKNALTALSGMIVFDSTLNQLCYYDGTSWIAV